jgi:hypothetical protein
MRTDGETLWYPGLDFPIAIRVCERCGNTWVVDPAFVLRSHIPLPRGAFWWQFAYAAMLSRVKYTSRLAPEQMSRALEMVRAREVVCGCADANCTCEVCQAIRDAAPDSDGVLH